MTIPKAHFFIKSVSLPYPDTNEYNDKNQTEGNETCNINNNYINNYNNYNKNNNDISHFPMATPAKSAEIIEHKSVQSESKEDKRNANVGDTIQPNHHVAPIFEC